MISCPRNNSQKCEIVLQFSGLPLIVAYTTCVMYILLGLDIILQDKYYFKVDLRCEDK